MLTLLYAIDTYNITNVSHVCTTTYRSAASSYETLTVNTSRISLTDLSYVSAVDILNCYIFYTNSCSNRYYWYYTNLDDNSMYHVCDCSCS